MVSVCVRKLQTCTERCKGEREKNNRLRGCYNLSRKTTYVLAVVTKGAATPLRHLACCKVTYRFPAATRLMLYQNRLVRDEYSFYDSSSFLSPRLVFSVHRRLPTRVSKCGTTVFTSCMIDSIACLVLLR